MGCPISASGRFTFRKEILINTTFRISFHKKIMRKHLARSIVLLALVAVLLLLNGSKADAHAAIVSSTPVPDQVLEISPKYIELSFSESIKIQSNSLRLFNSKGEQIEIGKVKQSDSKSVKSKVSKLRKDTYVIAYSVISADSHLIKSAFLFSVGTEIDVTAMNRVGASTTLEKQNSSGIIKRVTAFNRGVIFISLSLIIGAMFFSFLFGEKNFISKITIPFISSCLILILSSLLSIRFFIAEAYSLDILGSFETKYYIEQLDTKFIYVNLIRIALAILLIVLIIYCVKSKSKSRDNLLTIGVMLTVLLAFTPAFTGHSSAGKNASLAIIASFAHVFAVGIWFGGLVFVSLVVRKEKDGSYFITFSKVATWCVSVIFLSGWFAWFRQVGSIDAAKQTWFGQLVGFKNLLFVGIILIAFFSRKRVKMLVQDKTQYKKLLKFVYVETVVIVVILSITAVLVNAVPAKAALSLAHTETVEIDKGYIDITIDPNKYGPVQIDLRIFNDSGKPKELSSNGLLTSGTVVQVWVINEEKDVGPIQIAMKYKGSNHFQSVDGAIPFAGIWVFTARLTTGDFDQETVIARFNIK